VKRLLISLVAATMLFGAAGFAANRSADTPECCTHHESCCPGSSCCSGGKHSQCSMMHEHHA
jgi:hypothetical protein